ncbi:MAG TPA: hypothetical protein VMV86_05250, partial [Methanosarcinales archaeon]|nr:hypothetical protein [Methanosarcinales archaeon]
GRLRRSAYGSLQIRHGRSGYSIQVARGKKDGGIEVDTIKINAERMKGVTAVYGNITYDRRNEKGEDIALWAHEKLNPHGGTSPAARQPGTGPKFLEIPWIQNQHKYMEFLKRDFTQTGLQKALGKALRQKTVKQGKFTLNYTDLVLSNV